MKIIKFCGKNRNDSVKKALAFYHDNLNNEMTYRIFLAKCRFQNDKKTIHFYPHMEVNIEKLSKSKKRKSKADEN